MSQIPELTEELWANAQNIAEWTATTYKNGIKPTTEDFFGPSRKVDGITMIDLIPILVEELKKYKTAKAARSNVDNTYHGRRRCEVDDNRRNLKKFEEIT